MASVKDMRPNGFDYSACKKISKEDFDSLLKNGCRPEKGDVLVAKDGATMLKHAFVADGKEDLVVLSSIAILRPNQALINPSYLAHYFRQESFKEKVIRAHSTVGGVPRIILKGFKKMEIAVPSIEVQNRLVNVLDNFEAISSDLDIGLPTEIEARQKQYEYYRDLLLTFAETGSTLVTDGRTARQAEIALLQYVFGYAVVQLDEVIVSLNTGLNPRQFFKLNTDDAENYYITIREIVGGKIVPTDKTDRMNDEALLLCNNRSNLESGDVLFSGTGTIGETAVIEETPTNWNIKEGVYTIKPDQSMLHSHYLRYLLMTEKIKTAYMKKVAGGTVKSIPMREMKLLQIPLPAVEKQDELVEVISRFDKLCNDLSSGLPAEIEARQKQYEYYRDKLLTFKEKA